MNGEGLRPGEKLVHLEPSLLDPRVAATKKLHPTLERNIAAWDEFWSTIGLHAICGPCFRSETPPGFVGAPQGTIVPRGGCCRGCVNLSNQRCVAKPNNCASWICWPAATVLELEARFPAAIMTGFHARWSYRADGFRQLANLNVTAEKVYLKRVVAETGRVRKWTAKVRREAGMDVGEPT